MAEKQPIAVHFEDGSVVTLDLETWKWSPQEGGQAGLKAGMANCVLYDYSAGDGEPGFHYAEMVAERLGGEAVLPEPPPGQEGVLH